MEPTAPQLPPQSEAPAPLHIGGSHDLEIKDAQVIFNAVWRELEETYGHEQMVFPKELILLGGAPGSGKGTQTRFIMKMRGITADPIVVSSLLTTPSMEKRKDRGLMVGDREVVGIIFHHLLKADFRDGVVLDGFPRTTVQVECLKLLVDKINALHRVYENSTVALHFRKPLIHIMVLFVDEKTSIDRQILRGHQMLAHNRRVEVSGVGEQLDVRKTDLDPDAAKRRYRVFKEQTWEALYSLRKTFHYHFIDAEGSIQEVQANILKELKYQSSLELEPKTYNLVKGIPLASEIVQHARQDLIRRLDENVINHPDLFERVVDFVLKKMMPIVIRHAISGKAIVNTEDHLLSDPLALTMLIDVFSERGYHAVVDVNRHQQPVRLDVATGAIVCEERKVYRIQVRFAGSEIRRG